MKTNPNAPSGRSRAEGTLLWCGPLSSAWYVAMNIYVPKQDSKYDWMSQTVSELSAIDAPTRQLWVALGWVYTLLLIAFGVGLLRWGLRWAGGAMVLQGLVNPFWPPMHLRPVLAAGGETIGDTLHLVFTGVWAILSFASIISTSMVLERRFRVFSMGTALVLIAFGTLTSVAAPALSKNLATPMMGVWERINIAAYMLWVSVLAIALWRRDANTKTSQ